MLNMFYYTGKNVFYLQQIGRFIKDNIYKSSSLFCYSQSDSSSIPGIDLL
jgi:hypothetical protein